MSVGFKSHHWLDHNGKPAGGVTLGHGFTVSWQNGPLGRGDERKEPNGAFVEDVIAAARDRLSWYQLTGFNCVENATAIEHLSAALLALEERTSRRERAGIEGTHSEENAK